ncbi:hypothetical protein CesoFtcFv8_005556 [Champsocephalus esox]|uniref:Uncharacterized protein n=1 Tax=Champsocephalus esox TaxID=159716 RepID=A0AAN8CSF0_9TELE|nr:hypothetical protein CesoFtcFv8_005556 [Champsocephalus esox]
MPTASHVHFSYPEASPTCEEFQLVRTRCCISSLRGGARDEMSSVNGTRAPVRGTRPHGGEGPRVHKQHQVDCCAAHMLSGRARERGI